MLLSLGVQRGDRVLVYMPTLPAQMGPACARIGAIHSVVFGGFASHSVAARIDDARPVLIVSADAGARAVKSRRIKSCLMTLLRRRSITKHVLLVDRGLAKMAWVDGRDLILPRCQQHPARACRRGLNPMKPRAFLTPPASGRQTERRPARRRRLCGGAGNLDGHHFWRQGGRRILCASDIGWVVGHPIPFTRRCWQAWRRLVYEGLPTYPD